MKDVQRQRPKVPQESRVRAAAVAMAAAALDVLAPVPARPHVGADETIRTRHHSKGWKKIRTHGSRIYYRKRARDRNGRKVAVVVRRPPPNLRHRKSEG